MFWPCFCATDTHKNLRWVPMKCQSQTHAIVLKVSCEAKTRGWPYLHHVWLISPNRCTRIFHKLWRWVPMKLQAQTKSSSLVISWGNNLGGGCQWPYLTHHLPNLDNLTLQTHNIFSQVFKVGFKETITTNQGKLSWSILWGNNSGCGHQRPYPCTPPHRAWTF